MHKFWVRIVLIGVVAIGGFVGFSLYQEYASDKAIADAAEQARNDRAEWNKLSNEEKWEIFYAPENTRAIRVPPGESSPERPDVLALSPSERDCYGRVRPLFQDPNAYKDYRRCQAETEFRLAAEQAALVEAARQRELAALEAAQQAEAMAAEAARRREIAAQQAEIEAAQAEVKIARAALSGGDPTTLEHFPHPELTFRMPVIVCNDSNDPVKFAMVWQNKVTALIRENWLAEGYFDVPRGDCKELGLGSGNGSAEGYLSIFKLVGGNWVAGEYGSSADDDADALFTGDTRWICWPEYASNVDPDESCPSSHRNVRFNVRFRRTGETKDFTLTVTPSDLSTSHQEPAR